MSGLGGTSDLLWTCWACGRAFGGDGHWELVSIDGITRGACPFCAAVWHSGATARGNTSNRAIGSHHGNSDKRWFPRLLLSLRQAHPIKFCKQWRPPRLTGR